MFGDSFYLTQQLLSNQQSQSQATVYAIAIYSLCAIACKNQLTLSAQFVPLFVQETAEKQPLSISCWCLGVASSARQNARTCISRCFLFTATCLISPLFSFKNFIRSKTECLLFSAYCSQTQTTLQSTLKKSLYFYVVLRHCILL